MRILFFTGALAMLAAVVTVASSRFYKKPGEKCIAVFYDNSQVVKSISQALDPFAEFKKIFVPIDDYESGQLERCKASFIVNTEFDNHVPKKLVDDYLSSERNVIWMGYNVWHLGDQLNKKMGLRYIGSASKINEEHCALFYKGHSVRCSEKGLSLHPELLPTNEVRIEIMAESRSRGRELTPYVVRSKNLFYMADVNFGNVFQDFLSEFVGSPMRIKTVKAQQVAGPN